MNNVQYIYIIDTQPHVHMLPYHGKLSHIRTNNLTNGIATKHCIDSTITTVQLLSPSNSGLGSTRSLLFKMKNHTEGSVFVSASAT